MLRVVSHTCSNTEIVCALGCAEMLVGVDDHSDYPVEVVSKLPRIGPDLGVDVEKVKRLEPDLVLTSLTVPGHEKIIEQLAEAKLPILVVEPKSLADVFSDVQRIACALGVEERGHGLVRRMRAEAIDDTEAPNTRPAILVEWWPKPVIVPGRYSWVSDMITLAGGANPWAERDCKSTPITDEEAIAAAPDAIVLSWCGVKPEKVRPDIVHKRVTWRNVPAVAMGNIYCIPEAWMGRPGPRLLEGLRAIREVVTQVAI